MGEWISAAANLIIEKRQAVFRKKYHSRELSIADLEAMDADGDNEVTRAEYLEFMLLAMNQVDRDILIELNAQFDKLDSDGTGVLDKHDLIHAAKRKLKSARRKLELASYKEKLLKIGTSQRRKKFTNDPLSKLPSFGGIRRQLSRPN